MISGKLGAVDVVPCDFADNTEGYWAPSAADDEHGEGWTQADVAKLLREWKRGGATADDAHGAD